MNVIRMILTALTLTFAGGSSLNAQGTALPDGNTAPNAAVTKTEEQAPANRVLFSPLTREAALPKGQQEIYALATLALFIVVGLLQLRKQGVAWPAVILLVGSTLFYSAWVYHKWTISGREVILYGHLITWGVAALGLSIGASGLLALARNTRASGAKALSQIWILPLAVFLALGLATGTATIFEAAPTIFGIDAPLYQIGVMVFLGSCATTASILCFARALCRMQ